MCVDVAMPSRHLYADKLSSGCKMILNDCTPCYDDLTPVVVTWSGFQFLVVSAYLTVGVGIDGNLGKVSTFAASN